MNVSDDTGTSSSTNHSCSQSSDCPFNISCDPKLKQCNCDDIINMFNRNCSQAFLTQCQDSLFGIFCEYKCPENCKSDENKNGKCHRLEGTCDNFDQEQNVILTVSQYWYAILITGFSLSILLFSIYFLDYLQREIKARKEAEKNAGKKDDRRVSRKLKEQKPFNERSFATSAMKGDISKSTPFEEPRIENPVGSVAGSTPWTVPDNTSCSKIDMSNQRTNNENYKTLEAKSLNITPDKFEDTSRSKLHVSTMMTKSGGSETLARNSLKTTPEINFPAEFDNTTWSKTDKSDVSSMKTFSGDSNTLETTAIKTTSEINFPVEFDNTSLSKNDKNDVSSITHSSFKTTLQSISPSGSESAPAEIDASNRSKNHVSSQETVSGDSKTLEASAVKKPSDTSSLVGNVDLKNESDVWEDVGNSYVPKPDVLA